MPSSVLVPEHVVPCPARYSARGRASCKYIQSFEDCGSGDPAANSYFKSSLNKLIAFVRPIFNRCASVMTFELSNQSAASSICSNG